MSITSSASFYLQLRNVRAKSDHGSYLSPVINRIDKQIRRMAMLAARRIAALKYILFIRRGAAKNVRAYLSTT
jgi:hypothetical protein